MIAGYILTGGKNRRMNGEKKLFLEYKGKTFFDHIKNSLQLFSNIYLSVDEKKPYEALKMPMVVDVYPDIGPMGGIYSGLLHCSEDSLFVIACDMPLIDLQTVKKICQTYEKERIITIVQTETRLHPLLGIYPKTILPVMEEMIQEKNYRMMNLFARTKVCAIQLKGNHQAVQNVNTPKEYQKLWLK